MSEEKLTFRDVIGGELLTRSWLRQQIWVILLGLLFVLIYIAEGYMYKQLLVDIENTKREIMDLRYRVLSKQSDIMEFTRESMVKQMLVASGDSILKPANRPPYVVEVKK